MMLCHHCGQFIWNPSRWNREWQLHVQCAWERQLAVANQTPHRVPFFENSEPERHLATVYNLPPWTKPGVLDLLAYDLHCHNRTFQKHRPK